MPAIYVISGTQGAGKSTVAKLLAEQFSRGAWVSADALQRMIVAGRVWPEGPAMSGEAERQLWLRLKNACLLATSFVGLGIDAVIDDIVIGDRVIQTVNNYDRDVFNGDLGVIDKIDPLLAQVEAVQQHIARGDGSLLKLMHDPEFPEDAKELGKILKRQPWKIINRPAK